MPHAPRTSILLCALASLPLLVTGCHVSQHKDGDSQNVRVATPFGGVSVKTNDKAQGNLGLTVYPGAIIEKKHDSDSNGAADVSLSFGNFHLGVRAATYLKPDKPDAVMAFYRKDLARYGTVIQCIENHPVGTPTRTQDGLTCDRNEHHKSFQISDSDGDKDSKTELRAGSKQHQHIAAVESENGGTKIGLVLLDLPSGLSDQDGDKQQ